MVPSAGASARLESRPTGRSGSRNVSATAPAVAHGIVANRGEQRLARSATAASGTIIGQPSVSGRQRGPFTEPAVDQTLAAEWPAEGSTGKALAAPERTQRSGVGPGSGDDIGARPG